MDKKIVLIAEDDVTLRAVLTEKIKMGGYEVLEAKDGAEALEKIKNQKPDILLLDMIMPVKTGMDVLAKMQKDESLRSIPVVVISNSGQPVEIDEARKLGARDFLIKAAFDPNEVLEKVKKHLGDE